MSKKETYEARTEELLQPVTDANGLEIYDVEYVKEASEWYLRVYIDKPEGVNINDCELVSRAMSEILDKDDFIEEAYIFEVSSPGLGRTLKKERHFEKSIGKEVEVKTYKPMPAQKEFTGILKDYDKGTITIEVTMENEAKEEIIFNKADVAIIRLAFDF